MVLFSTTAYHLFFLNYFFIFNLPRFHEGKRITTTTIIITILISRETVLTSEPKLTVEICSLTLLSCSSYHLSVTFPCHKPHFHRISLRLLLANSVSFTLLSLSSTTFSHRLTNGITYQWPISCSIVYLLNPSIPVVS